MFCRTSLDMGLSDVSLLVPGCGSRFEEEAQAFIY